MGLDNSRSFMVDVEPGRWMCGLSPSKPIPIIPTNTFPLPIAPLHICYYLGAVGHSHCCMNGWDLLYYKLKPLLRVWCLWPVSPHFGVGPNPQVSFCHCVEHSQVGCYNAQIFLYTKPPRGHATWGWPCLGKSFPCVFNSYLFWDRTKHTCLFPPR